MTEVKPEEASEDALSDPSEAEEPGNNKINITTYVTTSRIRSDFAKKFEGSGLGSDAGEIR
uniref:Uncharacterized protein n=1 Tax=Romanomermis culicivorax TaxID=13658 RepID=A0A915JGI3_ROMCU